MPPRRNVGLETGLGRGQGRTVPSGRDPPPTPTLIESRVAGEEYAFVDTDAETVETDNATVNRELLRYLREKSEGSKKPIYVDFIAAGMSTFEGKTGSDPSDAEHWIRDLQRLFAEMSYPVNQKLRVVVSLLRGEVLNWWESVTETALVNQVTWECFREKF
ncbi:hypothetical protein V6N12_027356 [Hibiscus sabdariffa]|uniref:Retrotransposon gag domain-containing protein n=1 Tax=Hibiscus sabdariffa TaxID=183260 RepID=A0ABR2DUG2_9ROSI